MADCIEIFNGRNKKEKKSLFTENQFNPIERSFITSEWLGDYPPEPRYAYKTYVLKENRMEIPIIPWTGMYMFTKEKTNKILVLSCSPPYTFTGDEGKRNAITPYLLQRGAGDMFLGFRCNKHTYFFEAPYNEQPRNYAGNLNPYPDIKVKEIMPMYKGFTIKPGVRMLYFVMIGLNKMVLVETAGEEIMEEEEYPKYRVLNF